MLNPFPIQFLSLFAYFLIRLFIAGILTYLGFTHLKHRKELQNILTLSWFPYGKFTTTVFIIGEFLIAGFIFTGAFTQYAAMAVMAMSLKMIIFRQYFEHPTIPPKIFYILLFGTGLSLFVTGAGVLAFDLPI